MSIKGRLAAFAVGKAVKKIVSSGTIESTANTLIKKVEKYGCIKSAEEYIKKVNSRNYLIIKSRSATIGTIIGFFTGNDPKNKNMPDSYRAYDKNGQLLYYSDTTENYVGGLIPQDITNIYDSGSKKIGEIKEHLLNLGVPVLEKEVNKCSVKLYGEKICILKKYEIFGEREYETIEGNIKITYTKERGFITMFDNRTLSQIHTLPITLKDDYANKFIVEYDDINDEKLAVLLAIAIDRISN